MLFAAAKLPMFGLLADYTTDEFHSTCCKVGSLLLSSSLIIFLKIRWMHYSSSGFIIIKANEHTSKYNVEVKIYNNKNILFNKKFFCFSLLHLQSNHANLCIHNKDFINSQ